MKVLHVIPSLSPSQGGPSFALPQMERALAGLGLRTTVITTDDDGVGKHSGIVLESPIESPHSTRWYFRKQTEFYKISRPLGHWLERQVREFDLVHIHALFSYSSTVAAKMARRHGIPYIIRPLGVLNRWGMENRRRILKRLSFRFIESRLIRRAAAMHYTSQAEQREAEEAGAVAKAAVIPLGIDTEKFQILPDPELFLAKYHTARGKRLVLFLSRFDAKKGLDLLLPAFAECKKSLSDVALVLAGEGAPVFTEGLKKIAADLGLEDDIIWTGFLHGNDKLSAFAAASVFVLPSYSENFGIALVEAMACGLPCVTTSGVAVSDDIREADAGVVVEPNQKALSSGLMKILDDEALRKRTGINARKLVHDRFSFPAMGTALRNLYREVAV